MPVSGSGLQGISAPACEYIHISSSPAFLPCILRENFYRQCNIIYSFTGMRKKDMNNGLMVF